MAENSGIEWTTHTFNPWIGCTKVSPACDNCYAEEWDKRYNGGTHWGAKAERRRTKTWGQPVKWDKDAAACGVRPRVFCASLADVFDNKVPPEWRADLWALIRATPNLDWLLLTKRPQNIAKMLPLDWGDGWPNVWLGTTVENQAEADRRIPHLLKIPAAVRFLSCEPLFEPLRLWTFEDGDIYGPGVIYDGGVTDDSPCHAAEGYDSSYIGIDWVIVGGESGPNARPMHPDWARGVREQCIAASVPFLFKQWGEWHADALLYTNMQGDCPPPNMRIGKKKSGRHLDGVLWDQYPNGAVT